MVKQAAIQYVAQNKHLRKDIGTWTPHRLTNAAESQDYDITHFCAPVIHPMTGKVITQYKELSRDIELSNVWTTAFGKEFGNLTQGDHKTETKGTNAMFVMTPEQIKRIPADRVITYAKLWWTIEHRKVTRIGYKLLAEETS